MLFGGTKRKVKDELALKEQLLKNNLSNNYKDEARTSLKEFKEAVENLHASGELVDKDYVKYSAIVQKYENSMVGYHH